MFVSAIAAGCGGKEEPAPVVGPPVVIADPEPQDVHHEELPLVVESPGAEPKRPTPGPTHEGLPSRPMPFSSSGGMCRASKAPPAAKGCNDDVGSPGICSKSKCSQLAFVCSKCESYRKHFKPKVAQRAVACVNRQTRQQSGDGCETYRCGDEALRAACPDGSAQAACQSLAGKCSVSLAECTQMLSGMNAAGRAEVAACAARGCRFGLWSCIEGM